MPADAPGRRDVPRGRNCFVTATLFLNTVEHGGELNFAFGDSDVSSKPLVTKDADGRPNVFAPPGLRACQTGTPLLRIRSAPSPSVHTTQQAVLTTMPCGFSLAAAHGRRVVGDALGLMIPAAERKLVFYYSTLPDQQDGGEPDIHTFYQYCNPVSQDRLTATWSIMNKTWYDLSTFFLFRWTDVALQALLGLNLERILTGGYGWDWAEDPQAGASSAEDGQALPGPWRDRV